MAESIEQRIENLDPQALKDINQYIDELKGEAQGDYDFIVKFLKQQFQTALGTDDVAKAQFMATVSNQLEKRIGQIPFDFDLKTGREKADITNTLRRLDIEDTDLRSREKELEQQTAFTTKLEQEQRQEEFNRRGLLGSGLEKKKAQQQAEARRLELDPKQRALALEGTQRAEQRTEAQLQSGRRLEDLKTTARREALGETTAFEKGSEAGKIALDKRLADIRRGGQESKASVLTSLRKEDLATIAGGTAA
jgi:hypothetical protein